MACGPGDADGLYLIGWGTSRVLARHVISRFEAVLSRIPLVQVIYGSTKKLLAAAYPYGLAGGLLSASHDCTQPRLELQRREWLHEIVIRAQVQTADTLIIASRAVSTTQALGSPAPR